MNHGWQSEATDGPRAAKRKESAKRKKSADRSGKYFSTPETWTVECNCRRIFANIWFSQVWKHSSYTYAIPWCFKIWAWLRHEFLETAIPWWFTSKFWPRHELGMSLSFDCNVEKAEINVWEKIHVCRLFWTHPIVSMCKQFYVHLTDVSRRTRKSLPFPRSQNSQAENSKAPAIIAGSRDTKLLAAPWALLQRAKEEASPRCLPLAEILRVQPKKIASRYLGYLPPHIYPSSFFLYFGVVSEFYSPDTFTIKYKSSTRSWLSVPRNFIQEGFWYMKQFKQGFWTFCLEGIVRDRFPNPQGSC